MSQHREHWSSKLGFILAAIGSAVGLGILWKFPYTVGENGGGFFLFSYILCILVIGVPVFIAELFLGRTAQRASVGAFDVLSRGSGGWRIGGYLGLISSFLIMSFYSVIAGYGLSYVVMSLTGAFAGMDAAQVSSAYDNLTMSGSISLFWHALFTAITMAIVVSGVRKGIEFWTKIMTRALFLILAGLLIYNVRLAGFSQALHFIFVPDFSEFNLGSLLEALGLAFFTLSLGQGIMISYGSYMKKTDNIPNMSLIVAFSVIVVSILAALVIFPVVFTFDFEPAAGPGLVFKTLPYLFFQLPGGPIVSTIFFTLFVFTALTSAIPFIEVVATNMMELTGITRKRAALYVGLATFLFGVPSALAGSGLLFGDWTAIFGRDFLLTIEGIVSTWLIPIGGLVTAIFVGYIVDEAVLKEEMGTGRFFKPWFTLIKWVIPVAIFLIIIQKSGALEF